MCSLWQQYLSDASSGVPHKDNGTKRVAGPGAGREEIWGAAVRGQDPEWGHGAQLCPRLDAWGPGAS